MTMHCCCVRKAGHALMSGSGYRIVRPSCVTMKGTPPLPNCNLLTFKSLYAASSCIQTYHFRQEYQHCICTAKYRLARSSRSHSTGIGRLQEASPTCALLIQYHEGLPLIFGGRQSGPWHHRPDESAHLSCRCPQRPSCQWGMCDQS